MSPPQEVPLYHYLPFVENTNWCRPGGYHPVHLGDFFHSGRFEIVHKLGLGTYATVWLVKDHHRSSYASLKILRADYSTSELGISRHLRKVKELNNDLLG